MLGCERGSLFLVDDESHELWSIVAKGEGEEIRLPIGQGFAGQCAASASFINIDDAYQHPGFDPSFDARFGFRTTSVLCVPLFSKEKEETTSPTRKVAGVLEVINKHGGAAFDDIDLSLLQDLCEQISAAVYQCQKFHSAKESARAEAISAGKMSDELEVARLKVEHLVVAEERQKKLMAFSKLVSAERDLQSCSILSCLRPGN